MDIVFAISATLASLHVLAALSAVLAVYFAIRLYQETDKGWYWLSLVLSAVFFGIPQWFGFMAPLIRPGILIFPPIIDETSEILAGLMLAISCYGMFKTMHYIRKKVETDDDGVKKGARARKK